MSDAYFLIITGAILIVVSILLGVGGHIGVAFNNLKHMWRGHGK